MSRYSRNGNKRWRVFGLASLAAMLWMFCLAPSAHADLKSYRTKVSITHGLRLGGVYLSGLQQTDWERVGLSAPALMLMGYEVIERVSASRSLNVIFAQNFLLGGFEQGTLTFALNLVAGLDILDTFQFGMGFSLSPGVKSWTHAIIFVSWTPHVGNVLIPLTATFIPDKDGYHRFGLSIGVSWSHLIRKY
ncbi:MAG: hypothetical protein EP343_02390 [Deltaproteobacteria bacterium]|nr:MAG: hypothetical protein EP343_02390 [Deltaproteobacteria bacterium]